MLLCARPSSHSPWLLSSHSQPGRKGLLLLRLASGFRSGGALMRKILFGLAIAVLTAVPALAQAATVAEAGWRNP